MTLARACRDHEHVAAGYVDRARQRHRSGGSSPINSSPPGRRWYLLAFDRDRDDWRSLRLDRMADVRARGSTFVARDAPDAAAYVRPLDQRVAVPVCRARALLRSEEVVAQHFSPASVTIEADGPDACIVTAGADDPDAHGVLFRDGRLRLRGSRTPGGGTSGGDDVRTSAAVGGQPVSPRRSARNRNAAANGLSAVSARSAVPVQLFAYRADGGQQRREIAVVFVERVQLLGACTCVGGSTAHPDARARRRPRRPISSASTGTPLSRCSTSMTKSSSTHALNNQSSGVRSMWKPGLSSVRRGLLGVRLGDHEVDVVHGFRAAVAPTARSCRPARNPDPCAERRRGALERVAQIIVVGHVSPDAGAIVGS